jgi:hypothetical protein
MVGAGTTRAAIRITLSDRKESVSAFKTGCYISARSFAAIQFSRPQAPCLSAELTVNPRTSRRPLKRPPLGGLASAPTFVGRLPSSAPSRLSKGPPSSAKGVYHLGTGCQQPESHSAAAHAPVFKPTSGQQVPGLSAGSPCLSCRTLVLLNADERRRSDAGEQVL